MSIFKKKNSKVSDAQAYLRSTDNVSRPTAILMSLVAFLAVFAIVFSLFLGGKWLYERIQDSRENGTQQVAGNSDDSEGSNSSNSGNSGLGITVVDGSNGERIAGVAGSSLNSDQTSASQTSNSSETTAVAGASTSISGGTKADTLPRTGPGSTLLIVAGAVALGTVAHSKYSSSRR